LEQHQDFSRRFAVRAAGPDPTAGAARTFDVFVGSESFLLANMRHGGVGTISATANVNPAAIHRLYEEWKSPDADEQQAKLDLVREVLTPDRPIARSRQHATHAVYPTASPARRVQ
jgi:dihydrodipicolinate synthase/N-acetylneuraminate lyase